MKTSSARALAGWAVLCVLLSAPGAGAEDYVAQVLIQIDQLVDPQALSALTLDDRGKLAQLGVAVVDAEGVLRSYATPFAGHWVKIGQRRVRTDEEGFLRLATPPPAADTTNVDVFMQVGDTEPFAVLPSLAFVPESGEPAPTVLKLTSKLPPLMNPKDAAGVVGPKVVGCKRTPCAPITSPARNAKGCCIDYDNPVGTGEAIDRSRSPACFALGAANFLFSTCFLWTVRGSQACLPESAYPWNPAGSPNCYKNHKYRNCQNMDDADFTLSGPGAPIAFKASTTLAIRNNTSDNYTCLAVTGGPGQPTLALAPGAKGKLTKETAHCKGYRLDHFSDSAKKHYEDVNIRFTAPSRPAGRCAGEYAVEASALWHARSVPIRVKDGGCATARIEFSLKGENTTEEDIQQSGPPYSGHKTTKESNTFKGVINLKLSEDSDDTDLYFEPTGGTGSASWTIVEKEEGSGENYQGCKYRKTITWDMGVAGSLGATDDRGSVQVTLDENGGYSLSINGPIVKMKGSQTYQVASVSLTPQCTAAPSSPTTTDREEDMFVEFEGISGQLANSSAHAITGSKPVTVEPPLGIPMKGTLKWTIAW